MNRVITDAESVEALAAEWPSVGTEDARRVADRLQKYWSTDVADMLRTLVSERDALAVRVAELEADAQRLDWMEKNGGQHTVCVSGRWYVRKDYREPHVRAGSLRSAIDAALTTPESKP